MESTKQTNSDSKLLKCFNLFKKKYFNNVICSSELGRSELYSMLYISNIYFGERYVKQMELDQINANGFFYLSTVRDDCSILYD